MCMNISFSFANGPTFTLNYRFHFAVLNSRNFIVPFTFLFHLFDVHILCLAKSVSRFSLFSIPCVRCPHSFCILYICPWVIWPCREKDNICRYIDFGCGKCYVLCKIGHYLNANRDFDCSSNFSSICHLKCKSNIVRCKIFAVCASIYTVKGTKYDRNVAIECKMWLIKWYSSETENESESERGQATKKYIYTQWVRGWSVNERVRSEFKHARRELFPINGIVVAYISLASQTFAPLRLSAFV